MLRFAWLADLVRCCTSTSLVRSLRTSRFQNSFLMVSRRKMCGLLRLLLQTLVFRVDDTHETGWCYHVTNRTVENENARPNTCSGLLRRLGAGVAGIAAASSGLLAPSAAEAVASPAVQRRPPSKRKRAFLCDETVSYLQNPSKQSEVWLVGTAHISNSSAQVR